MSPMVTWLLILKNLIPKVNLTLPETKKKIAVALRVMTTIGEKATSHLAPYQYGIGISSEDEIIVHGLRRIKEVMGQNFRMLKIDLENTFNMERGKPTLPEI